MVRSFCLLPLCSLDKAQIVVRVARILVSPQRLFEIGSGPFVFATAIVRQAQRDMRGCEAIAPERLLVSRACFPLSTLLVRREPFDISLLGAGWNDRIRNRSRCRLEIGIAIRRAEVVIADQFAPVLALKANLERHRITILNRQRDRRDKGLRRVEVNTLTT